MLTRIAAAVFALLAVTAPSTAHAVLVDPPFEWYQDDILNLTYPNNTTLTGDLHILDAAPMAGAYRPSSGSPPLSVDGSPVIFSTQDATGSLSIITDVPPFFGGKITFFVPPDNDPSAPTPYGETPLYLSVPNIFLNGVRPTGGTVHATFCTVATSGTNCSNLSGVPLPAALPLFGTALAGLGGAGWWKRRKDARSRRR